MLMPSLFCVMLTDICRKVNVFYRLSAPYGRDTSKTFHCLTITDFIAMILYRYVVKLWIYIYIEFSK